MAKKRNINPVNSCKECKSLKGRILFLTEQLVLANQELEELKREAGELRRKAEYPMVDSEPEWGQIKELSDQLRKVDPNAPSLKALSSLNVFFLPVYNWKTAKVGGKYRQFYSGKWNEIVAPEIDGEGNPTW